METTPDIAVAVDALYIGAIAALANDGAATGIDKRAVASARRLDVQGLDGDAQADRVHHGGAERALNHYPAEHYAYWRARYPGFEAALVPGALGENISTHGLTEADVCIGDIFTLGSATLQVAQPRQPCWKIGARLGIAGLARAVAGQARAGWFYRVLEPGAVRAGDRLACARRAPHGIPLTRVWQLQLARHPNADQRAAMVRLAEDPALAPSWRKRFAQRLRR